MPQRSTAAASAADAAASLDAYGPEELRGVIRTLLETSRGAVLLVDGGLLVVVDANAAAAARFGLPLDELKSRRVALDRLLPAAAIERLHEAGPSGECLDQAAGAGRFRRVDAPHGRLWVVAWEEPAASSAAGAGTDNAAEPAGVDPLTGLADRGVFARRLREALTRAAAPGAAACAVLFVDLDGFKPVNDQLGHRAGDRLLRDLARGLADCVRPSDLVARYGGDEFTVLLEGLARRGDALGVARRILDQLADSAPTAATAPAVTASIGVAYSTDGHTGAEAMLQAADEAMYAAKRSGKSQWAVAPAAAPSAPRSD